MLSVALVSLWQSGVGLELVFLEILASLSRLMGKSFWVGSFGAFFMFRIWPCSVGVADVDLVIDEDLWVLLELEL